MGPGACRFSTGSLASPGTFEIKDEKLQKYYKIVERMKGNFVEFILKQNPHATNIKVDELAQLASSLRDGRQGMS